MPEIDKYIPDFKSLVNRNGVIIDKFKGEFGLLGRVLYDRNYSEYYYLQLVNEWFWSFGEQFKDRIPAEDRYKDGISVAVSQIKEALIRGNSYIVIRKQPEGIFYGCHVKDWNNYFEKYKTLFIKSNIDKIPQACIPITMLFDMKGFRNTNMREGLI